MLDCRGLTKKKKKWPYLFHSDKWQQEKHWILRCFYHLNIWFLTDEGIWQDDKKTKIRLIFWKLWVTGLNMQKSAVCSFKSRHLNSPHKFVAWFSNPEASRNMNRETSPNVHIITVRCGSCSRTCAPWWSDVSCTHTHTHMHGEGRRIEGSSEQVWPHTCMTHILTNIFISPPPTNPPKTCKFFLIKSNSYLETFILEKSLYYFVILSVIKP